MPRASESRTELLAVELLKIRGWDTLRPPRGNLLWKQEYRDYPHLLDTLAGRSKSGPGDGFPDFIIVERDSLRPLVVGETKADAGHIGQAKAEAQYYADAFLERGLHTLTAGVAGSEESHLTIEVSKHAATGWRPVQFRQQPISWLPTPEETEALLGNPALFDLRPAVPKAEVLAERADYINRVLRECDIKDEFRPAVIGAFMLALCASKGEIRMHPEYVLLDINKACERTFQKAGKYEISKSILVPESNSKLAARASEIINVLYMLSVPTLTAAHDYLGQLYETFFRYTGKNTIGQIFTPRHVTDFIVSLCNVGPSDFVVDPSCGTGGFLIAALYRMIGNRDLTSDQIRGLVEKHLIGFETEPITAALCVANMILRGDGTTAVVKDDCFTSPEYPIHEATVAVGNPPFPHKATDDPPEKFVDRGLEALRARGLLAMVVPISLLVKRDKAPWRERVLEENTLKAVITLPSELFQPYASSTTGIIALERGTPHKSTSRTFFCHIANDGFRLKKNVRVPRHGSQLGDALDAFDSGSAVPGLCNFAQLQGFADGREWAPGEYIAAEEHSFEDLAAEVEILFRDYSAFHARYAARLAEFSESLASGKLEPKPYADITNRMPVNSQLTGAIGASFDIYYGQRELHSKEHLTAGESLIISSKGTDNGCYGFYDFENLIAPPFVTVPSTGSIGQASVQTWPCGVTDDCLLLIPRKNTRIEDLWIAAATARLEAWRFNYGRKITPQRLQKFVLRQDEEIYRFVGNWLKSAVHPVVKGIVNSLARGETPTWDAADESRFTRLAEEWKRATGHLSSMTRKCTHPTYQEIIGMGRGVIPFMLRDLRESRADWFWALTAITGENPITDDIAGNIPEMTEAWLRWGKAKGHDA